MDVGFHDGRVGANDVRADRLLRNSVPAKQFVDPLPGRRPDGEKALVQEAEVHHGLLSHPQEVLEERFVADADDGIAEGKSFEVLYDQRPQDVLRGVVPLPPGGIAFGKLLQILMNNRKDFAVGVEP